jgi:hypothetical protein
MAKDEADKGNPTRILNLRAQDEILRRMDDKGIQDSTKFRTRTLIQLWKSTMKMLVEQNDAAVKVLTRDAIVAGLKAHDPEIIKLVKEVLWSIPEGDLEGILNGDKSGDSPEIPSQEPTDCETKDDC